MNSPISPTHPADADAAALTDVPDFLPWFGQRRCANGWTPDRQRKFLEVLQACGSVQQAAAAVGKSARSALQLRDKPGAEHFAVVWTTVAHHGREKVAQANFARSIHGELQPVYYKGKYRGIRVHYPDRIALGVLEAGRAQGDSLVEDRYRLQQWEIALRRREMDLDDTARGAALLRAEEHAIWRKEIAAEDRRRKAVEVRALLRASHRRRAPAGPQIRQP